MKNIFIIIFLLFSYLVYSENDFRNVNWGMTPEEIKKAEKETFIEKGDDYLVYQLKIDNREFYLFYYFFEDKFIRGIYRLKEEYNNENTYLTIYNNFKNILIEKYKKPSINKEYINEYYKDYLGMALSNGKASYYSAWNILEKTTISMYLTADNLSNIIFMIGYESIELAKLEDAKKKEKDKNNF